MAQYLMFIKKLFPLALFSTFEHY